MSLKSRGAPFPAGSDPNDTVGWIDQLAAWVNDRPGVAALTTAAKNALTGVDRWDGKLVLDTTLDRLYRWDAGSSTWIQLPDTGDIAALLATSGTPADLGLAASRGVSSFAARADHIHAAPAWAAYTPTAGGGITVGNGVFTGRVSQIGKTTHFWAQFVLGTTSAITGVPTIAIPVPATAGLNYIHLQSHFVDAGSTDYEGEARLSSTTMVQVWARSASGAYANVTSTVPFTWTNTDSIEVRGTYEAA